MHGPYIQKAYMNALVQTRQFLFSLFPFTLPCISWSNSYLPCLACLWILPWAV